MKLKGKIFLALSLLIILLALLFYLFFFFFFRANLKEVKAEATNLIIERQAQERESELKFFKRKVEKQKEQIDALFHYFTNLSIDEKNRWEVMSSFLVTNPNIDFVQLNDIKESRVYSLLPELSLFHPVTTFASTENYLFVVLPNKGMTDNDENLFLAYPTPQLPLNTIPSYLLFSWKESNQDLKNLKDELSAKKLPSYQENNDIEKAELINILSHYYESGLEIIPEKGKKKPIGVALLSSDEKGKALLANEVFLERSFFDDMSYIKNQSQVLGEVPKNQALIFPNATEVIVVNTGRFKDYLITLGFSFSDVMKEFAEFSHHFVLLTSPYGNAGFNPEGQRIPNREIDELISSLNPAYSSKTALLLDQKMMLYLIPLNEDEEGLIKTFSEYYKRILYKVSLELIIIVVALMMIALLILSRLIQRITDPVMSLVGASDAIRQGRYKEIQFHGVEKRKDEFGQLGRSLKEMALELQEKDKIRNLLNRVVSKEIAEEILKSDVHLGGEDRVATILFADIRNFTEITQNMPPQKVVKMLNEAMTMMSRVIEGEGGLIDKFVGDEVMALYGIPIQNPDHAIRALATARLMIESLKKWNIERKEKGEEVIEMGIGINTGIVVAGNMGAEDRLNYTVIGPSVNLASRLCKAALPMQIIISEFTLEEPEVRDSFFVEPITPIVLKGFRDPVKIFSVTGFKWEM